MIDLSSSGMAYNRLDNLDGIEDRIIYYLISPTNKSELELLSVHTIWRLLYYNDCDALQKPLPKYSDIVKLIYNRDDDLNKYRIFRSPRMDDAFVELCSLIKIYVDAIIPTDHLKAVVNVGIDIVSHSKLINVTVPDDEINVIIDEVEGIPVKILTKSRVSMLTQCVVSLLNGANVAGVGKMIFSRQLSIFDLAQYGIWNKKNFEGIKLVIGTLMSGVN